MNVNHLSSEPEQMDEDQLRFWRGCFREALPDCLSIERSPEFCAQVAGEVADASVREYRRRLVEGL